MSNRRNPRPRYKVGAVIEFASNWQTRGGVGTVIWVTQKPGNLLTNGRPEYLYRVEVDNGYGAFGNSTRFIFEHQIQRQVKQQIKTTVKVVKAA